MILLASLSQAAAFAASGSASVLRPHYAVLRGSPARLAGAAAVTMAEGGRVEATRRRMLAAAIGGVLAAGPRGVGALCGSKPQSWEFWIPWNEELLPVMSLTANNAMRHVMQSKVIPQRQKTQYYKVWKQRKIAYEDEQKAILRQKEEEGNIK